MTPKEKKEHDARLLAAFVCNVKHYRAVWGIPPDKTTFLNAWRAARQDNPPGRHVSPIH